MKLSNEAVKRTVLEAYKIAKGSTETECKHREFIDFVLDNTHLTYKYILVTALASKATDDSINPLCLQAKSELPGAYDARSICHDVIVKFEMNELGKALGGSNEPFLNKPARFPELSKTNAVRRGRDQSILFSLCDNLPLINSSNEAFACLVYALKKLILVKEEKDKMTKFSVVGIESQRASMFTFIDQLMKENMEGEVLTLVVAGLYEQYMSKYSDYVVEVHPVNQSGASSKEISDLDIYKSGKLFIANEIKDKPFVGTDIQHAADKVIASGNSHMFFIVGRRGTTNMAYANELVKEYLSKGFMLSIVEIDTFVHMMLNLIDAVDIDSFIKYMLKTATETKFKEVTVNHILGVAARCFELKR